MAARKPSSRRCKKRPCGSLSTRRSKDVLDYLSQLHHIPIIVDGAALKEAGVEDSTPITCKLSGIPLRSALEIVLDEIATQMGHPS